MEAGQAEAHEADGARMTRPATSSAQRDTYSMHAVPLKIVDVRRSSACLCSRCRSAALQLLDFGQNFLDASFHLALVRLYLLLDESGHHT